MSSEFKKIKDIFSKDKRKTERLSFPLKVEYSFEDENWKEPVSIQNASGGGINLIVNENIQKEKDVSLKISIPDHPTPIFCQGKVIWTKECPPEEKKELEANNIDTANIINIGIEFGIMEQDLRETYVNHVCENILNHFLDDSGEINE